MTEPSHAYPKTIEEGLTTENLDASMDAQLRSWTDEQWDAFTERFVDLAFGNPGPRPRMSIPPRADDDDLLLGRIVHYARSALSEV